MQYWSSRREIPPAMLPDGVAGPSRAALLIALVDRVRHDRAFHAEFRRDPIVAAQGMAVSLSDAEWAGLRDLLAD